ncbi:SMC family ATPase [Pseudarthrobacter sp. NamE2]|uniref:AAA family ATPase n=1 Tax=Pseudarthrobacter sp. NamE2 TaxID=2576838 RepID=UPI0010FD3396|nr:SMC family ATPase [Pseudarthrobacter sp. NamE2]TLM82384.1 SMC family ATPase [Pseudarthrobacter sp. NamE2]
MRIHHLRISGFGPFPGTEDIDFDRLSGHGLFLLNGPTGAGKTSVLDAICFALYGSVPGARQDGKRLRSDHAEPAQEPAVTCEFSAQGRRFEVTRSPAWDRPSARGKNGFTTQQVKTLLRELVDGEWVEKSARNDEAGAEILALLGMDREQFTRVVMLPQGDFAAFLRSKAADRLELLQKLFGTQRFEALENELARQAAEARDNVAELTGRLELLIARAESEAGALELDEEAPPADNPAARLEWLVAAVGRHHRELTDLAVAAETGARERALAVEEESGRRERRRRLEAAVIRRAAVQSAAPQLESLAARIVRHRQAEVLAGHLASVDAAGAKVRRAANAAESAVTLLRLAAAEEPELAGVRLASAEDSAQGLTGVAGEELGRLRSLLAVVEARLPDEDRLQGLRTRHSALSGKRQDLAEGIDKLANRVAILEDQRNTLARDVEPLEVRAGTAALRAKEAAAAAELLDVVRRHAGAASARDALKLKFDAAREHQLEAKRRWLDLREERLANAAAELAAQLEHDGPCPVCGSVEHPAPAPAGTGGPSLAQEEEDAHALYEAADTACTALGAELAEANQQVAVLAGQGGDTPEKEAVTAAGEARAAAADAESAVTELTSVRTRLDALDEGIAETVVLKAGKEAELAQVAAAQDGLAEEVGALDTALAGLRSGHRSLSRRLRSLEAAVAVLGKAVEAQAQLDQAQDQAMEAREQLELALPKAGFTTADEARNQLLGADNAAALERELRAGQDEAVRVSELFESEDIVRALGEQSDGYTVDEEHFAVLQTGAADAGHKAREARLAAGLAGRRLESLAAIKAEYEAMAGAALGPAERAAMLAGLADAAAGRGDNTYRMSLNSYVLAARLEQVALAASERLVAMSDGRYLLQHTDARAARGAKSGLGLEVVDQWTGYRRDTSTLSGGESFMASLSLALGLADVVQQESGGVEIETLFVDEGFGSLDEQSLEQVMDALEGLRDGGRVVGLVSHVGEMKQRIGTQLQVLKGRNGSTLRISETLDALP